MDSLRPSHLGDWQRRDYVFKVEHDGASDVRVLSLFDRAGDDELAGGDLLGVGGYERVARRVAGGGRKMAVGALGSDSYVRRGFAAGL